MKNIKAFTTSIIYTLLPMFAAWLVWNDIPKMLIVPISVGTEKMGRVNCEGIIYTFPFILVSIQIILWFIYSWTEKGSKLGVMIYTIPIPILSILVNTYIVGNAVRDMIYIKAVAYLLIAISFIAVGLYLVLTRKYKLLGLKIFLKNKHMFQWTNLKVMKEVHFIIGSLFIFCGFIFLLFTFMKCDILWIIIAFSISLVVTSYVYLKSFKGVLC